MGRNSPFGLKFLVRRKDSGRFAYARELPPDVVPFVSATIALPWRLATTKIGGSRTIKVSFDTSDLAVAKERWLDVERQVREVVAEAERRARLRKADATALVRVSGLSSSDISLLAEQERHAILSNHDRELTHGSTVSPMAKALFGILKGASADDQFSAADVFKTARVLDEKFAREGLMRSNLDELANDKDAYEFEVPDGLTAEEASLLASRAINEGTLKPTGKSEGPVTRRLAANGIELHPDHPDRRATALAIIRARADATAKVVRRDQGEVIDTPPEPPRLAVAVPSNLPTITTAIGIWASKADPRPNTLVEYTSWVRRFVSLHGDLRVDEITKRHISEFSTFFLRFPRAIPANMRGKPVRDIAAWAEKQKVCKTISRESVNKGIGALSAILGVADIPHNPAQKQKLKVKSGNERLPYSDEDLRLILQMPIYNNPADLREGGGGWAAHFIPLIAMFTGARLEEIAQLRCGDVVTKRGDPYFNFVRGRGELTHQEAQMERGPKRSFKTISSDRCVPVHSKLIELGLLDYLDARRRVGDVFLFPDLLVTATKRSAAFSKFWAAFTDEFVTNDEVKVFHSFRHRVIDELRSYVRETVQDAIVGHANQKTGRRYGGGFEMHILKDAIEKVKYPALDFSHLIGPKERFIFKPPSLVTDETSRQKRLRRSVMPPGGAAKT